MLSSAAMQESPEDVLSRMRGDWDRRAEEDHKLHIATGHAGSEETFRASGAQDLDAIVLDGVTLDPSAEILEIGCGVGRLLVPLAERVAVAHGVDISPVMIGKSKEYASDTPNVKTALTDGAFQHLRDASLDFVFSFIVFQHIPDRAPIRRYVEEAARVLKPGGVFRFQVDGRWWWTHAENGPDTYNGVKFSPEDVRALLEGTPFAVVDSWGAEGHYHWVTARKAGEGAAVSVSPREWDLPLFVSLLRRLGSESPEEDAAGMLAGKGSLRPHLLRLVERLASADHPTFVSEAYRTLLGRTLDDAGRAFHVAILEKGFEDRAALLDTVTTSRGFLDLYRPFVPDIPWFLACEILMRLGESPRTADFFELLRAGTSRLGGRAPRDAITLGFETILGFEADEAAFRHHLPLVEEHPDGHRLLIRALLSSRKVPAPPPARGPHLALLPGESAPGEAALAMRVLTEGRGGADDRAFVRLAYERLFGRAADADGESFYYGKLEKRELSRAGLLRELLWSDEGRARSRRLLPGRSALWLSLLLALLPLLPSWSYLASRPWVAMSVDGDNALLEITTRRALHGEQLLGSYSRFGWNHPGPIQFTLMAPVYILTGSRNASVYAAALTWNTLWVLAATFVAWRLGGSRLALLTAGALGLLLAQLGPGLASHAWGPHAIVAPLFLFVLLVAGLALRGWAWMPGVAFVGTFLVQTHLGTGPTVVTLLVAALFLRRRAREADARVLWLPAAWTAAVLAFFWAPPLVEQLRDFPGNMGLLLAFFRVRHEAHSFGEIVDPLARQLGALPLSLATVLVPSTSDQRGIAAGFFALALVALLPLAAASTRRRGLSFAFALGVLSIVAVACAYASGLKIVGPPLEYLFLFVASLGATGWLALAAAASGEGELPVGRRRAGLAVAAAVLVSLLATDANVRGLMLAQPMPVGTIPSVKTMSESLKRALGAAGVKRPLIVMEGNAPWISGAGVVLELDRARIPFAIEEAWRPMFGRGYARDGREDAVVLFADGGPLERNGGTLVARVDEVSLWLLKGPSSR
ncbi:MAG TPA: methyltransferase domain-containing protein [Thermoanaerobaculia bacterium]